MGLIDDIVNVFRAIPNAIDGFFETVLNPSTEDEQASDVLGDVIEDLQPVDEAAGALVDAGEEFILSDVEEAGQLTPENVEDVADRAEGGATSLLIALALGSTKLEAASLGQLDTQSEFLAQALIGLGFDDVTGTELEARMSEGVMPALEQKVNQEHRAKQVNLQDVIERDLRNKDSDFGYIEDVSTYGIKPEQVEILEQVALNDMEFEELIETPAELGLIVPDAVLESELDRAGYAEPTKEFLAQVNNRIPLSTRSYEELVVAEDHIADLDIRVEDGTLTPEEALELVPDQLDTDRDVLRQRWEQKARLEPQAPSQAEFIDSLVNGYVSLEETVQRLQQDELDVQRYEDVLQVEILGELDGAMQEAVALGQLSEAQFSDLAGFAGVDDEAVELLLQGASLSDIVSQRLQAAQATPDRSVRTIVGIGESRGQALIAADIETVEDLAAADAQTVADATQVSPETAQEFITQAQQRLGG